MRTYRVLPLLVLMALLTPLAGQAQEDLTRFIFEPESRLWIEGTSSLHDWTCTVEAFDGALEAGSVFLKDVHLTEVSVPVQAIECKNGKMNKKMLDALDAEAYPSLSYTLDSVEAGPAPLVLHTRGRLTVAGVERALEMDVQGEVVGSGRYRLTGSVPLLMSDFHIDPPRALLGRLKTGDRVEVHFDVVVKAVEGAAIMSGSR